MFCTFDNVLLKTWGHKRKTQEWKPKRDQKSKIIKEEERAKGKKRGERSRKRAKEIFHH